VVALAPAPGMVDIRANGHEWPRRERPPQSGSRRVRREERRGEPLAAFDLAERGLAEHPDSGQLKHRAVLALARSGATEEAARRFLEYGLADSEDEDIRGAAGTNRQGPRAARGRASGTRGAIRLRKGAETLCGGVLEDGRLLPRW